MSCINANNWKILSLIYKAKRPTSLLKTRKRWADNDLVGPQIRLQPCLSLADGVLYDSHWPIKRLHYWTWSLKTLSCKFQPVAELFLIFARTKYGQRCRKYRRKTRKPNYFKPDLAPWQCSSLRDRVECKTRKYKASNPVGAEKAREMESEKKLKLQTRLRSWWDLKVTCNQKSSFYHSKDSHPVNTLAKFYSCVVNT